MAYDIITPATLDALDETTPLGAEDPSLIDEALRQTRNLVKNVILKEHNADGTHKEGLVAALGANSVTSSMVQSNASDNTKRAITGDHIVDDAIVNRHISDGAVQEANMAANSVNGTALKDGVVTASHLGSLTITTDKLANDAVTDAKLSDDPSTDANRAVGTNHIKDGAVTTDKLATGAITPAKFGDIGNLKIVVGDGSGAQAATVGGDISLTNFDDITKIATFALASGTGLAYAKVVEAGMVSTTCVAGTPFTRPMDSGSWTLQTTRISGLVSISGSYIVVAPGTYWVMLKSRIDFKNDNLNFASSGGAYHKSYLYNVDLGQTVFEGCTAAGGQFSFGAGLLTVSVATNIEVRSLVHEPAGTRNIRNYLGTTPRTGDFGVLVEFIRVSTEDV